MKGLLVFGPFCLCAFALGVWGFMAADPASSCHADSLGKAVFHALLLVARSGSSCMPAGIGLPVQLVIAQILLPLLLALGAVLAAIRIIIANLRHDTQLALIHAMRGHTIVCGLGETGLEAARQLVRKRGKAVAVSLDPTGSAAKICESFGVPLIAGDATLHNALAAAGIGHARAVIICTGADALNLEICLNIAVLPRRAKTDLLLYPEIRGGWISKALAERQTAMLDQGLQLHPFNTDDLAARILLRRPAFSAAQHSPRLLFIGFGALARAILHRAILCNYALPGLRPQILCLDAMLETTDHDFGRFSKLADIDCISHGFGAHEAADDQVLEGALARFRPDIAVIALPEDAISLPVANLLRSVLDRNACAATPVFVRVRKEIRLCGLMAQMAELPFCADRIRGFGDLGEVVSPDALFDEQLDALACAVHETYLAHATGDSPARVPWNALAERYRQASRAAADHIPVKLAQAGYVLRQEDGIPAALDEIAIERMAAAEHHRWSLALRLAGWCDGETRNEFRKTHPMLVPWEALPETTREENRRQIAAIPDTVKRAGLRVLRLAPVRTAQGAAQLLEYQLDINAQAGWAEAEAALIVARGVVRLHHAPELRAEQLRALGAQYPNAAAAMAGWM